MQNHLNVLDIDKNVNKTVRRIWWIYQLVASLSYKSMVRPDPTRPVLIATKILQTFSFTFPGKYSRKPVWVKRMYSAIRSLPVDASMGEYSDGTNLPIDACLVLTTDPKPRLRWTTELHERFIDAVTQLGGPDSKYNHTDMGFSFCVEISGSWDELWFECFLGLGFCRIWQGILVGLGVFFLQI